MPRRSSGGRPAPRAAPRPAPSRNLPPQKVNHAPPPAVPASGGGSIFGGIGSTIAQANLKKSSKRKKHIKSLKEEGNVIKKKESIEDDIYQISFGDEDCSKGMKKWILEYHQRRPGLNVLQERIDDFIAAHDERVEQERKEKEAKAAEDGWTVVVHHKGRKKTTEVETGVTVGSVTLAAAQDHQLSKKKKNKEMLDFYRFQRREARKNEIMMLQSKFEQDKKRIQQMRAARKFRPY